MIDRSDRNNDISVGVGSYCESPNIAVGADGNVWMAWVSNESARNERGEPENFQNFVFVRNRDRYPGGVHLVSDGGVCHRPVIAVDNDRPWVFWAKNVNFGWHICGRQFDGTQWGKVVPVSGDTGVASHCDAASDGRGGILVAWEAYREKKHRIYLARISATGSDEPMLVNDEESNHNHRPALCADADGNIWVAWDRWVGGRYDAVVRRFDGVVFSDEHLLSSTGDFNGLIELTCDRARNSMWAVWHRWCGDYSQTIQARCWDGTQWKCPRPVDNLPAGTIAEGNQQPRVLAAEGTVRFFWTKHNTYWDCVIYTRVYRDGAWSECAALTRPIKGIHFGAYGVSTQDRDVSVAMSACGKNVWMVWQSWLTLTSPAAIHLRLLANLPSVSAGMHALCANGIAPLVKKAVKTPECDRMAVTVDGETFKVYWGDLHGHSRLSYDGEGEPDEWFRRARYVSGLDFAALTDHDRTIAEQYLSSAAAKAMDDPSRFVALNGYEVVFDPPSIGDKVILEFEDTPPFYESLLAVGEPLLPRERFYRTLEKSRVLIVSHDGAFGGGICDNDEHCEPLMPVVQVSSTHAGDYCAEFERYVADKSKRGPAYVRWQDALAKGYRYGAVGGSDDHNRRPQVRTGLFLRNLSRDEIYAALRARRCFAVTPCRIALDFRVNGYFMGSVVRGKAAERRLVSAVVRAPAPVKVIDIVKNNQDVFSGAPDANGRREWSDSDGPRPGDFYYARVTLDNGHMAWASPVWFL